MDSLPLLSLVTFLPLVGGCVVAMLPAERTDLPRKVALLFAVLGFVVSLPLLGYDASAAGIQFAERYYWVPSLGISWHLGIDGISLWLVMLTTFLGPVVILGAWEAVAKRPREFFFYILALQTSVMLESRRLTKQLEAQRALADQAEHSRFNDLRGYLKRAGCEADPGNEPEILQTLAAVEAAMLWGLSKYATS